MNTLDTNIIKVRACINSHEQKIAHAKANIADAQKIIAIEENYLVGDRNALIRLLNNRSYKFLHSDSGGSMLRWAFYIACLAGGFWVGLNL